MLDRETDGRLSTFIRAYRRRQLSGALWTLPLVIVPYIVAVVIAAAALSSKPRQFSVAVAAIGAYFLLYGVVLASVVLMRRRDALQRFVSRGFDLVEALERAPGKWPTLKFRNDVVERLESMARILETYSLSGKAADSGTRQQVGSWALGVATHIRSLKLWAIWPQSFTYTDLIHELAGILQLSVTDRWRELPQKEPQARDVQTPSRWVEAGWITLGLLLLGLAGATVVFASKAGPAATFLAPLVGIVALLALTRGGLSVQTVLDSKKALDALGGDEGGDKGGGKK